MNSCAEGREGGGGSGQWQELGIDGRQHQTDSVRPGDLLDSIGITGVRALGNRECHIGHMARRAQFRLQITSEHSQFDRQFACGAPEAFD